MSAALLEREHVFKAFSIASGSGFGALGVQRGHARIGRATARFRTLGGLDVDPIACADFERIVGAPCACVDLFSLEQYVAFHGRLPPEGWREATPQDIRDAAQGEFPDFVFWSPPCKGLSSLQTGKRAASPRYQALNELVVRALDLALDAFADNPPALFILENVPRIATRGRDLRGASPRAPCGGRRRSALLPGRVDMMIHRVAISDLYRDSPTTIRLAWAFRDVVDAHVMLDWAEDERARAEAEHGR